MEYPASFHPQGLIPPGDIVGGPRWPLSDSAFPGTPPTHQLVWIQKHELMPRKNSCQAQTPHGWRQPYGHFWLLTFYELCFVLTFSKPLTIIAKALQLGAAHIIIIFSKTQMQSWQFCRDDSFPKGSERGNAIGSSPKHGQQATLRSTPLSLSRWGIWNLVFTCFPQSFLTLRARRGLDSKFSNLGPPVHCPFIDLWMGNKQVTGRAVLQCHLNFAKKATCAFELIPGGSECTDTRCHSELPCGGARRRPSPQALSVKETEMSFPHLRHPHLQT